jgi:Protein of unknown function (DUF3089)
MGSTTTGSPGGGLRPAVVGLLALGALVAAGCGSATPTTTTTTREAAPSTVPAPPPGTPDASGTVWLCRPGQADDPCAARLTATVVRADGSTSVRHATAPADPSIDCFYVYPTVSRETTPNADLRIQPAETDVAVAQASRFSQVCKVYAPMYPQLTLSDIGRGGRPISPTAAATAYLGVLSAWKDYLAHDNHGRGVVLIGHSQGAALLIPLIKQQIDPDPAERHLLVSALLMGGNVTVPVGGTVGGDFAHVPACRTDSQTGCVVAYSTFDTTPPADSLFGRVGSSLRVQSGAVTTPSGGLQILCTNPAALAGGTGTLVPYLPSAAHRGSIWVTYPDRYTATCMSSGGATWLQVDATTTPGDTRPVVTQSLGPRWGLHLVDVNIALGNLVSVVGDQSAAYRS